MTLLCVNNIAYPFEGLAKLARNQARYEKAARLFGAAGRLFPSLANTLSPEERCRREENLAATQMALGEKLLIRCGKKGTGLPPSRQWLT